MEKSLGIGTRALNGIIDTLMVFILSFFLYQFWKFYVMYYRYTYFQYFYFFYLSIFIYYFIMELFFQRTLGKIVTLTKVVSTSGLKPAPWQILVRSLIRVTLIYPFSIPFLGVGLHDYFSKTLLVEKH